MHDVLVEWTWIDLTVTNVCAGVSGLSRLLLHVPSTTPHHIGKPHLVLMFVVTHRQLLSESEPSNQVCFWLITKITAFVNTGELLGCYLCPSGQENRTCQATYHLHSCTVTCCSYYLCAYQNSISSYWQQQHRRELYTQQTLAEGKKKSFIMDKNTSFMPMWLQLCMLYEAEKERSSTE